MTTIFYIEDSPVEQRLVQGILSTQYTVVLANDGLEAVQKGEQLKPDLVLTDLNMPGLDGYEVATKLKAAWPDVPIVALTGDSTSEARRRALIAGCDGLLTKPITPDDLLQAVKKFLSGYRETLPNTPEVAQAKLAYQLRLVNRLEGQILALTQANNELMTIQAITRAVTAAMQLEDIIRIALEQLHKRFSLEGTAVLLHTADDAPLTVGGRHGFPAEYLSRLVRAFPRQHPADVVSAAIHKQEPQILLLPAASPFEPLQILAKQMPHLHSLAAFPLLARDRVVGVLHVGTTQNYALPHNEKCLLEVIAQHLAVAVDKARMYDDLQTAYHQLRQLDDLKNRFVMIASHELRTPLTLLKGYAHLLAREFPDQSDNMLDIIIEQANVLQTLLDRILDVNRLQHNDFLAEFIPADLATTVQRTVNNLLPMANDKGIVISVAPPPQPVQVWIDPLKFQAILTNLLDNAIKFTTPGGRVEVAIAVQGDSFEVAVQDTGIGIPAEEQNRIFDKFYQVASPLKRAHGGIGLGLSIAREMASVCGGTLTVHSAPGEGATFTYRQPVHPVPASSSPPIKPFSPDAES